MENNKFGMVISIIGVVIALLTIIFGDNLFDRMFSGKKLIMESTKFSISLPKELEKGFSDYALKNNTETRPDMVRVINIKNEGYDPSKNIKFTLVADGEVLYFDVASDEDILEKKLVAPDKINIKMGRLSTNSSLQVMIWMSDKKDQFLASYVDDVDNHQLSNKKGTVSGISILRVIMIIVVLILMLLTGWLYSSHIRNKLTSDVEEKSRREIDEERTRIYTSAYEYVNENCCDTHEDVEQPVLESPKSETKNSLKEFIKTTKNNSK